MKDEEKPEKDIFEDLDKMYQRVADIEKEEAAEVSVLKKEKPEPKEERSSRRSSRPILIAALIVCIISAGILAFPSLKEMIASLLSKKSKTPPPFVATPPVPKAKPPAPPPVPKEQEAMKIPPKEIEKPEPLPPALPPVPKEQEAMKVPPKEIEKPEPLPPAPPPVPKEQEAMKIPPKEAEKAKPIAQEKYYTIQIGAFHELQYARDLLKISKREGLDAYLTKSQDKKRGTSYKVFVGHFKDEKEGTRFLKEKKILDDYPGSFVRKEPSFKIHQLIEGK
jgi:hypothetical protein